MANSPPGVQNQYDVYGVLLGTRDSSSRLAINAANLGRMSSRKAIMTSQRNGLLTTASLAGNAGRSFLIQKALAGHCTHVRIGVLNASPTATPQLRVRMAASEVAGDPTLRLNQPVVGGVAQTTNGAWAICTKNGNATPNLRAVAGSTVNNPFVDWFDWFPIESLARTEAGRTRPILNIIVEYGGAECGGLSTATTITLSSFGSTITGWEQDTDVTQFPFGAIYRSRQMLATFAGVDATLMTGTTPDTATSAAIVIQYVLRDASGIQIAAFGDSLYEGSGETAIDKAGWLNRTFLPQSTLALPIEILQCAQAGSSTTSMASMAKVFIPEVPNSIVIFPTGSPNTTMPLATFVTGATIVSGGTGGANGAATLTGTTGTGTPFQIAATISGGVVISLGAVTTAGSYTALPTDTNNEPVTGGSVTGCVLKLKLDGAFRASNRRDIATIRQVADMSGCAAIQGTWMPANTSGKDYLGSDPVRQSDNADLRTSGRPYIELALPLEGLTSGSQIQYVAGASTDNLHPNLTGHGLATTEATKFSTKFTGI